MPKTYLQNWQNPSTASGFFMTDAASVAESFSRAASLEQPRSRFAPPYVCVLPWRSTIPAGRLPSSIEPRVHSVKQQAERASGGALSLAAANHPADLSRPETRMHIVHERATASEHFRTRARFMRASFMCPDTRAPRLALPCCMASHISACPFTLQLESYPTACREHECRPDIPDAPEPAEQPRWAR